MGRNVSQHDDDRIDVGGIAMLAVRVTTLIAALLSAPIAPAQTEIYNLSAGWAGSIIVAGLGDLNNDGYDDFGAVNTIPELVVFSGASGARLFTLPVGQFGSLTSIARVGDTDGDGSDDFVVGSGYGGAMGSVTVVSGATGQNRWRAYGAPGDRLGWFVSWVGDVNVDGIPDVLAAGSYGTTGLNGYAVVYSGVDGTVLWNVPSGPQYQGNPPAVAGTGDMNGDLVPDFIVATPPTQAVASGSVRGFSGANGSLLFTATGQSANDGFGAVIDAGGDVDGDGFGDYIVGGGGIPGGRIWAMSGATGQIIHTLTGPTPSSTYGAFLTMLNDLDGDGRADFTIRSGLSLPFTFPVFSGATGAIITSASSPLTGSPPLVQSIASGGDIYPDGKVELLWGTVEIVQPLPPSTAGVRVISFAPVPQAAVSTVGMGCGVLGPILAMQPPILGTAPWIGLWNGTPNCIGYLFLSPATVQATPIGGGCTVYLDPANLAEVLTFVTTSSGYWATQIPLSRGVAYASLAGRLQAAIVPPQGGLELTNAVDFLLGY